MNASRGHVKRLTVLMDGATSSAEDQIPWALLLSRTLKIPLTLLHVSDPARVNEPMELALAMAADYLKLVAASLPSDDDVEVVVKEGLVREEWQAYVRERPGSFLMIPARGHGPVASAVDGSVTDDLLRTMISPLVIVPSNSPTPDKITRVVVGCDRTPVSEAILSLVNRPARERNAEVIEVEVAEPRSQADFELLQVQPVISPGRVMLRGRAGPSILAVARARDADLIVAGGKSKRGPFPSLTGSTAEWLARHTDRTLVLLPQAWVSEVSTRLNPAET